MGEEWFRVGDTKHSGSGASNRKGGGIGSKTIRLGEGGRIVKQKRSNCEHVNVYFLTIRIMLYELKKRG